MSLLSIKQRLNNSNITSIDKAQRIIFSDIIKGINLPKNASVLSISTGDGFWDYYAFINNLKIKSITATDIVDNPVKKGDIKLLNTLGKWNFVKVKKETKYDLPDDSFDLIFHQDVVEHVEKPYLFLEEQFRMLKKNGVLIIGTPNLFRPVNILKLIVGKLKFPIKIGYQKELGDYIHQCEYSEQHLKIILKEIGFNNVRVYHSYFGIHFLNIVFALTPKGNIGQSLSHFLNFVAVK